jgi:phosphopantothenoylcysteine decarboxylase/phosphopantothenate--cysteine ligase
MTETSSRRARRILLCATGGYQCYTLPGFVLALLRHATDDVQVVLSRAAARLVSPYAVEVASRHRVYVELDDTGPDVFVPHIELSRAADLVLVYPATVNVLGKVAAGIADELIPALVLAAEVPVFFVPVSNPSMTGHPAVRRSIRQLREDGYVVLPVLPDVEVATREGLEQLPDQFPMPTLLAQLSSVIAGTARRGIPERRQDEDKGPGPSR